MSTFARRQPLWRDRQDWPLGDPRFLEMSRFSNWLPVLPARGVHVGTTCHRVSRYNGSWAARVPNWYTAPLNSWCLDCFCSTFEADVMSAIKGEKRGGAQHSLSQSPPYWPVGHVFKGLFVLKTDWKSTI